MASDGVYERAFVTLPLREAASCDDRRVSLRVTDGPKPNFPYLDLCKDLPTQQRALYRLERPQLSGCRCAPWLRWPPGGTRSV